MKIARLEQKPEIFYSIQGEGKNSGRQSIFVRLSLCNLRCVWCDTDYAWNWDKYKPSDEVMEMIGEEVIQEIRKYPCKNIVLTGGEPMLQQEELAQLMAPLKKEGFWFEVETNGTLLPIEKFDRLIDQYNCSPKLSNSKNVLKLREEKSALEFFSKSPKATFKFVIVSPQDLQEVCDCIERYKIPREKVYLMPEGTASGTLQQRSEWLSGLCKETGFQLTDRLHIHMHGAKRGV